MSFPFWWIFIVSWGLHVKIWRLNDIVCWCYGFIVAISYKTAWQPLFIWQSLPLLLRNPPLGGFNTQLQIQFWGLQDLNFVLSIHSNLSKRLSSQEHRLGLLGNIMVAPMTSGWVVGWVVDETYVSVGYVHNDSRSSRLDCELRVDKEREAILKESAEGMWTLSVLGSTGSASTGRYWLVLGNTGSVLGLPAFIYFGALCLYIV